MALVLLLGLYIPPFLSDMLQEALKISRKSAMKEVINGRSEPLEAIPEYSFDEFSKTIVKRPAKVKGSAPFLVFRRIKPTE